MISNLLVREGDIVQALTSGAGGVGDPKLRPQKAVINDLMNGYITDAAAINTYGLDPKIANEVTNIDGKR